MTAVLFVMRDRASKGHLYGPEGRGWDARKTSPDGKMTWEDQLKNGERDLGVMKPLISVPLLVHRNSIVTGP
jgi:hypothetical protein